MPDQRHPDVGVDDDALVEDDLDDVGQAAGCGTVEIAAAAATLCLNSHERVSLEFASWSTGATAPTLGACSSAPLRLRPPRARPRPLVLGLLLGLVLGSRPRALLVLVGLVVLVLGPPPRLLGLLLGLLVLGLVLVLGLLLVLVLGLLLGLLVLGVLVLGLLLGLSSGSSSALRPRRPRPQAPPRTPRTPRLLVLGVLVLRLLLGCSAPPPRRPLRGT